MRLMSLQSVVYLQKIADNGNGGLTTAKGFETGDLKPVAVNLIVSCWGLGLVITMKSW